MIKIIQTIVLTAVVFSPLSLISLVASATAHHTSSHVSSVAVATTQTRKKAVKKGKKPATTGINQPKTTPDATTQSPETMPSSGSMPVKPNNPDTSIDKMKPSGVVTPKPGSTDMPPSGNGTPPSGSGMPPSDSGTPPSGSGMPSTPSVPGSGTPTLPSTVPNTK